ncbi:MAG: phosphoenolpyruvate synthase [Magnetococcales bacterium]|nr:phosphoenolpyruvate synthase [Magnetococcales bacterium]
MSRTKLTEQPKSDALQANLRETAVETVSIDPRYQPLREVVVNFTGILKNLDRLLLELNHPFRNWKLILPELRGFVLKNCSRFSYHSTGSQCFLLFSDLFFGALSEVRTEGEVRTVLEGLTAYIERQTQLLQPEQMPHYKTAYEAIFFTLSNLSESRLLLLSQTHHPLKRTVALLMKKMADDSQPLLVPESVIHRLAVRSLRATYDYWLRQSDPEWFAVLGTDTCRSISHKALTDNLTELEQLAHQPINLEVIGRLIELPSFMNIIRDYKKAADLLGQGQDGDCSNYSEQLIEGRKLRFLFHIMEIDGLSMIHEETLREINRSLVRLIRLQQQYDEINEAFIKAFSFLKANVAAYPHTALQCIEVLGVEVFKRNNSRLVESFLEQTVRFGFQFSSVTGVGNDWQPICNPAHLYNIRVWLNLITINPQWSPVLFSALIINLKLTGALIRDTDLFQREISNLLNSGIRPVYNLTKQFCRQLPVYYNEIGAEGELRTVSTELDEISRRKDRLIHFLRKQCHVESTNRIVDLSFSILEYWRLGDKTVLSGLISDQVMEEISASGPYFDAVHEIVDSLFNDIELEYDPIQQTLGRVEEKIKALSHLPEPQGRRVLLMIRLCHLLELKYNLGFRGIRQPLRQAVEDGIPGMDALLKIQESGVVGYDRLVGLLDAMEHLKQTILSDEVFPAHEEIYQKRHIAVDIPSVYGCYQERKFDALSLSFRLENLANVDLEGLVSRIPEDFITRAAFFRVYKYIKIFLRALRVDGVTSRKLNHMQEVLAQFLELNHFSYHQYLDIFRNFSEGVKDIILIYYTTHHRDNLSIIIPMVPKSALLPKFAALKDTDDVSTVERIGESFLRDMIAETFGLQAFDRFIGRILQILARQQEVLSLPRLDQLMTYDPAKLFCALYQPDKRVENLIHLGNKGFNLVELVKKGLPVPAGSVLTTEFFRCRPVVREYTPATRDFMARLRKQVTQIEEMTGLVFGSSETPLLLSVRSGALISMPGMMQTIHNVGLNEKIVEGLAQISGNAYFAWDNYRRFIQSWCMTFEADRGLFSELMRQAKRRYGIKKKRDLNAEQMQQLAMDYRKLADKLNFPIPDNPWQQLIAAINQVVESWESKKAREYRSIMNISDDWGTAVVLQRMVYGNIHNQAGSGVLFTSHPHRKLDRVLLWGDYTPGNQGEDIVGGLVSTNPISVEQCEYDGRDVKTSLERCYPNIYNKLLEGAIHLVDVCNWNPQEIEFTFDGPEEDNLFFLQSRDMVTTKNRQSIFHGFTNTAELRASRLVQGIGVSGGALCGLAVFNLEQVEALQKEDQQTPLILIRYDTVPDDIRAISLANGLLTARGGQTSHAAIVAARLEKTCVVGCEDLTIREDDGLCEINEEIIQCGDRISIDGNRGVLYKGWHAIETSLVSE